MIREPPGECGRRKCRDMQWTDEGIVLGSRRHGEGNAIAELITREHGRHLGMVRGGAGSRQRPALQPGNTVRAVWRARLDEHLGNYAIEAMRVHAASSSSGSKVVYGVTHLAALCRLLPERDPHPKVYDALTAVLDELENETAAAHVARFELLMLTELGFGLDLAACAATGQATELDYVSPKSGRAVSRDAGAPWRDRLLRLPAFFSGEELPSLGDVADGFALTGFFFARYVLEPRGLTFGEAREGFIATVLGQRVARTAAGVSR
jgi:DNA repair protein RecO (recombination protein O)